MKIKLLLLLSVFLFIIAGCKKDRITPVKTNPVSVTNSKSPLSVANLLQSNMVIQRDKPFTIWGKAAASATVKVTASWNPITVLTTANGVGDWALNIPAAPANATPQTITVKTDGAADIILNNILIGDVWICSGQSNMVMPVGDISPFEGVANYQAEIAAANYPSIRAITLQGDYLPNPIDSLPLPASWQVCSPSTAANFSAIAYYFARKLNTALNIPIGIIISAVNGSYCESWTDKQALASDPTVSNAYSGIHQSSQLYNGMINPLTRLAIKGFTWYQGENNEHDDPTTYAKLNSALITGWRTLFKQGELPFYYVQMTPFDESGTGDITLDYYAKFREGQAMIRSITPGTGMVVTMDVGEVANHHPINKKPVGERLALLAFNKTYGQDVQCVGPQYSSYTQSGNNITINFVNGTANGLNTINGNVLNQYFYVAGTDQVFRLGKAVISGDKIIVTAPAGTPLPIEAVRYAFTNFPVTNLQNSATLPMEPFRTDNWSN